MDLYGTDIAIHEGDVVPLPAGDLEPVQGVSCLAQDLAHRLDTPRGGLWLHPGYGFDIQRFVHLNASPAHVLDFELSVAEEVEQDPRVEPGTAKCQVLGWDRERIRFRLTCKPIADPNPMNLVLEVGGG